MRSYVFSSFLCFAGWFSGVAQVTIQAGAQLKTTNDVLIVFDNIDVINHDAASDFSSSVMMFKGNTASAIAGAGNWTVRKIILDKPSAQLNLSSPVQVNERLQLVNGLLDLNGQLLTLFSGATLEGENEITRIMGPGGGTVQTSLSLNNPAAVNPGNLGAVISSSQNLGIVTVKRSHASAGEARVQRLYEIVPLHNTALNATLRLHYLDAELNTLPEPSLMLYSRNNNAETWSLLGSSGRDIAVNYVEKSGLSSLQQYSLATGGTSLPLVWGPVSATCKQNKIEVTWTTLQESNVQQFVVQRSRQASQWTDIATIPATGNANTPRSYTYLDAGAGSGNSFYRIRSEDIDRQTTYSGVAVTQACAKKVKLTLAPVPAQTETMLTIGAVEGGQAIGNHVSLKLIGADGRVVRQKSLNLSGNMVTIPLSLQGLANGSYYVEVLLPDGTREVLPLTKQ